ncbi:UDP-glucuronosyltransferase 3A1 [Orchesella cincta]|uniref:UDP-glucuronosyltransferase 3A1 n=1 Tax=Orchesella cincta TaxID=48709 RepID=A0A1D2ME31_ORCCI|nr:UDP-glucuronosyltransferase 3A1 [Orchesella cincta]
MSEELYRKYLPNGNQLPGLEEIMANSSLLFSNSHFTINYPRPLLPDVIEVGGMHTRPAGKLPKDLDDFLSNSGNDGFIFFSLGHPNIRLFITHGGLLSTQESIYHGVPVLGIPVFADQDLNVMQAERGGYAKTVEIVDIRGESGNCNFGIVEQSRICTKSESPLKTGTRSSPNTP